MTKWQNKAMNRDKVLVIFNEENQLNRKKVFESINQGFLHV